MPFEVERVLGDSLDEADSGEAELALRVPRRAGRAGPNMTWVVILPDKVGRSDTIAKNDAKEASGEAMPEKPSSMGPRPKGGDSQRARTRSDNGVLALCWRGAESEPDEQPASSQTGEEDGGESESRAEQSTGDAAAAPGGCLLTYRADVVERGGSNGDI